MAGGPIWGGESEELNATVLEWPPGGGPGETVSKLDVVYAVLGGSMLLNGEVLDAGEARIVPKDTARTVVAGPDGIDTRIDRLEETLRMTSICGLGQVALGPVMSVLRRGRTRAPS